MLPKTRTPQALGALGERTAYNLLVASGYRVALSPRGERGDLHAFDPHTGELITVEVKTARRGLDGCWRFCLRKLGHTDHRQSDILLLLAVFGVGRLAPFVIPVQQVAQQRLVVISQHPARYTGKYAQYRQPQDRLRLAF